MRFYLPCTALGLALVAVAPAAQAQALIGSQPVVTVPAATTIVQPVRTVRTVTTVRTVRRLRHRRVVVTRRTYVTDHIVPATTTTVVTGPAVSASYPAPLYDYVPADDYVAPAPVPAATAHYYREPRYGYYREPLYDTVVTTPAPVEPAPAVVSAAAVSAAPAAVSTDVPFYRYVYQPDRILVIDPNTGVAVQALPR